MEEEIVGIFIEEAGEILEELEIDLLQLESKPTDYGLINKIFRGMHTLKGSAGLTGLDKISDFVHHAEDLLDRVRSGEVDIDSDIINLLLESRDLVIKMIDDIKAGEDTVREERVNDLSDSIKFFLCEEEGVCEKLEEEEEGEKIYRIKLFLNKNLFGTGTEPLMLIKELEDIGEILDININLGKIPQIYELDPEDCHLNFTVLFKSDLGISKVNEVFLFIEFDNQIEVEDISENFNEGLDISLADKLTGEILVEKGIIGEEDIKEALIEQKRLGDILTEKGKVSDKQVEKVVQEQSQSRKVLDKSTIKVEVSKLEKLMNTMAELIISQAKLRDIVSKEGQSNKMETITSFDEVDKRTRDLQEDIMKARMVPIEGTFLRFRRLVRDLSKEKGKKVTLEIKGRETELDKKVIEEIGDPLKHMIRNSIDHGVEAPQERVKKGKSEEGRITLNAYHREGHIVIEVSDDGKGLNKDKIIQKALANGIIKDEEKLSEEEIYKLIFKPGFSTSKEITETSGRGVGMDVVKSNIESLRGSISISSKPDEGTQFKLKLPLTLAIIDGMGIRIGEDNFIIPLNSIIEFIQPSQEDLKTVEGKGELVRIRDDYIRLTRLYKVFNIDEKHVNPHKGILVIVHDDGKKVCLLVDEILGQQQAVVKNLEDNYKYIEGLSGATIFGDGSVGMILDIPTIINMGLK